MIKQNQKLLSGDYFVGSKEQYKIILKITSQQRNIKIGMIMDGLLYNRENFLYRMHNNPEWSGRCGYNFLEFVTLCHNTFGDIWTKGNKL